MPHHIEQDVFTVQQFGELTLAGIHAQLIARAFLGPLSRLSDGHPYVIRIHPRNPQPIEHSTDHRVSVEIRYWLADPNMAGKAADDIVYGDLLRPDKQEEGNAGLPRATRGDKVFEAGGDGWKRID